MISEEMCDLIIDQYYDTVFRYCLKKLRKTEDAEDCAQETFLVFFQKRKILFMQSNIKTWLLKTADNVIKRYQEKNWHNDANIDDLSELLPDTGGEAIDPLRYIEDFISKEDAELLRKYVMCNSKQEREALAKHYHMTLHNLTTRISRIKKSIISKIDN